MKDVAETFFDSLPRHAVDALPMLVAYVDGNGRYRFVNTAYERWFGLRRDEIEGRRLRDVIGEAAWQQVAGWVEAALAGRTQTVRAQIPYAAGPRHVEVSYIPDTAADGRVRGFYGLVRDMGEQRALEDALRASESRFRRLSQATREGVVVHDGDRILDCNDAYVRMLGCTGADQVIGRRTWDFIAPQSHEMVRGVYESRSEDPYRILALRPDGTTFPAECEGGPIDVDGRHVRLKLVRDLTALRRSEVALRAREDRLRVATEAAGLGVFEWDMAADVAVWENDRMYEIFGHRRADDPPGKTQFLSSYLHPDDADRIARGLAQRRRPGESVKTLARIRRRDDGALRWVAINSVVAQSEEAARRLVGVVADVTADKQVEAKLRESEERFRLVADNAPVMLWMGDETGRCIYLNRALRRFWGVAEECVEGFDWNTMLDPDDAADMYHTVAAAMQAQAPFETEGRFRRADGRIRVLHTEAHPRFGSDGGFCGMIGVNVDITERREAEQHAALLMREVNHRAKNLLAVVQAVARQTARGAEPTQFAERFGERLAGLAASHDLVVGSEWRGVDLAQLVRSQIGPFRDLLGSRIRLDGPPIQIVPSAAQAIGMALHELATNSGKYGALSTRRGRVDVAWDRVGDPPGDGAARFRMRWSERHGPPAAPSPRKGFGHTVMVDMVRHSLAAEVSLSFDPPGVAWAVEAPVARVLDRPAAP